MKARAEQLSATLTDIHAWHTVVVKISVVPGSTEDVITLDIKAASGHYAGRTSASGGIQIFCESGQQCTTVSTAASRIVS